MNNKLSLWLPFRSDFQDHSRFRTQGSVQGYVRIRKEAAYFKGEGAWIVFPNLIPPEKPFAIASWIRLTGGSGDYGIVEQKGANRRGEWLNLTLREGMHPWLGFDVNVKGKSTFSKADGWRHLVAQYTGEKTEIYVNGVLEASVKTKPFTGREGHFVIGRTPKWSNLPTNDFRGYLSDFRLYSRSLSPEEIAYLAGMDHGAGLN